MEWSSDTEDLNYPFSLGREVTCSKGWGNC